MYLKDYIVEKNFILIKKDFNTMRYLSIIYLFFKIQ